MRTAILLLLLTSPALAEHPLQPLIRLAETRLQKFDSEVQDYTCKVVKRETLRGVLQPLEFMNAKIRQDPFSIYVQYLSPTSVKGRELLYVDGQEKLLVKRGGRRFAFYTTSVSLDADIVKESSNYSIKDMGFARLLEKMLEISKQELLRQDTEVTYYEGVKIEGRLCTMAQIRHAQHQKDFDFYIVRLYIDDQMQLPVRFEAWGWPEDGLKLMEEFTLLEVNFNQGLTDLDFDHNNPKYGFRKD